MFNVHSGYVWMCHECLNDISDVISNYKKRIWFFSYQVICMCVYLQIVLLLRTDFTILASLHYCKILTVFGFMILKSTFVTFLQKTKST